MGNEQPLIILKNWIGILFENVLLSEATELQQWGMNSDRFPRPNQMRNCITEEECHLDKTFCRIRTIRGDSKLKKGCQILWSHVPISQSRPMSMKWTWMSMMTLHRRTRKRGHSNVTLFFLFESQNFPTYDLIFI